MLVVKRTRDVTAAMAAMSTHGSGHGVYSSQRREPSEVYGYGVRSSLRFRTWSEQAMAWKPAQQATGTDWIAPYLAQLLDDPYDAVRFGAARSLRSLPGFANVSIDVVAPSAARRQAQLQTMSTWDRVRTRPGRATSELLMTPAGELDVPRVLALLRQRNTRSMLLRE